MRLPIIPLAIAAVIMGGVALLLTSSGPRNLVMDAPRIQVRADVDGVETEVAVSPDGERYAVVASGDVWLVEADGRAAALTATPEAETAPAWTPDGTAVLFSRGPDTFAIELESRAESLHSENATQWDVAPGGRAVFVRDRALWRIDGDGADPRVWVPADVDPAVAIRSPRLSPEGDRVLYLKSWLGLRGEVWIADRAGGAPRALIADRHAENPTAAEWLDADNTVYVTDRSAGVAVWHVDLQQNVMVPLTHPLMGQPLAALGLDVSGNRILVPRHTVDAGIWFGGGVRVEGPGMPFAPAVSRAGDRIAYTAVLGERSEIWMAAPDGTGTQYVTDGRHPRFAPSGNEIVYSNTDLDGNRDIWKIDVRTGIPVRLTDDAGIDDTPDWSPDGRTILFASERGGAMALWTVPSSGGRRLRWNDGGYAPRFSPDGRRVAFWNDGRLWTANADGADARPEGSAPAPAFPAWSGNTPVYVRDGRVAGNVDTAGFPARVLPVLDRSAGGAWLFSGVGAASTELLEIELTYVEQ